MDLQTLNVQTLFEADTNIYSSVAE